jgi:PAS domain S-box-containing protein
MFHVMDGNGEHNWFEFIVNASSELLSLIDSEYVYNEANLAFCNAHGKERHEIVGHTAESVWGPDVFQTQIKPHIDKCFQGKKVIVTGTFKFGVFGKRLMEINYHPYDGGSGHVTHCVVASHDVTELKLKEQLLQKLNEGLEARVRERTRQVESSNNDLLKEIRVRGKYEKEIVNAHLRLRQVIDSIQTIIIHLNLDQTVVRWNPMAEKYLLLPLGHTAGKRLSVLPISWDKELIEEGIDICRVKQTSVRLKEITIKGQDEKIRILGLNINPIVDSLNKINGFLLWGTDITDMKNLEFQVLQSQKLESIGQLAAGVAHEINTPMQYIGDNLEYIRKAFGQIREELSRRLPGSIGDLGEIPSAINEAIEGVTRVTKIVRSMREFSHPGQEKQAVADINLGIESTINVSRNEWKYWADLVFQPDTTLPGILCNSGELNQAFLNIIINAAHAIHEKQASTVDKKKGRITIRTKRSENDIVIEIEDTGGGIPENIRNKIFDPFFTTKVKGKGTGQGLFIARKAIMENHGGSLSFNVQDNIGTTFVITLPISGRPPLNKQDAA